MAADDFDDRLALLEEHVVTAEPESADDRLARAERALAAGDLRGAGYWLRMAKIARNIERIARVADGGGDLEEERNDV